MEKWIIYREEEYIAHHGIKGQKWGVRRFQNEDGSLTEEGKKRYYNGSGNMTKEGKEAFNEIEKLKDENDKEMYDLLKKYDHIYKKGDPELTNDDDIGSGRYFDKDGYPYDDYVNFVNDLKSYAKNNGHKNVSESDINRYNSLYKQHQKDVETWRYLAIDRSKKSDAKRIGKGIVNTLLIPVFGPISLVNAITQTEENSAERKIYKKK